ncbi:MAG: hypothetical protein G01um101472_42 [Parcubacteria group bacterium Gr01-1014_72]|nr:MAG: hypothetical protein G01um101472_42 [Parcubacteria group bacterium Gr01-1014_72]
MMHRFILFFVVTVLIVGAFLSLKSEDMRTEKGRDITYETRVFKTEKGESIKAYVADTELKTTLGLGAFTAIAPDQGMLFIPPEPDFLGIWMEGMQFPIDIVWLNEAYGVLDLRENISPDTYPEIFYPATAAHYVLELPAGGVARYALAVGSTFSLR